MDYYVHRILFAEAAEKNGRAGLLLQPDYSFLFSLLSSLKSGGSLRISHIICFSHTDQMTPSHGLYNLNYLESILPMYFADLDYQPYYFYDDIAAHFQNFNGFPCMILTSEYAITCTSDYQRGILYKAPAVVSLLWELYQSYQDKCTPLLQVMDALEMNDQAFTDQMYRVFPCYVFQPEACVLPLMKPSVLERALYQDLPNRPTFIRQALLLLANNRKRLVPGKFIVYFTMQGLRDFTVSGRIEEIPYEIYRPLTIEERAEILEAMLPYCQNGVYRALKKPFHQLTKNLHLVVNAEMAYLLFHNMQGRVLALIFQEPGLLSVFSDYLESLNDTQFYSPEETEGLVRSLLSELRLQISSEES